MMSILQQHDPLALRVLRRLGIKRIHWTTETNKACNFIIVLVGIDFGMNVVATSFWSDSDDAPL